MNKLKKVCFKISLLFKVLYGIHFVDLYHMGSTGFDSETNDIVSMSSDEI